MIIYKIENKINGKIYIGQTVRELKVRIQEHCRKNSIISKALKKYGIDNFNISIIDNAENIDSLNEKEDYYIKKYNCIVPNGYNSCGGGGNTIGYKYSDESRALMSKNRKTSFVGNNNPFYGRKHTDETRAKMKAAFNDEEFYNKRLEHLSNVRYVGGRKVKNIDTGEVFETITKACESVGKTQAEATHISRVCKGKRKSCFGYRWEYVD